MSHPVNRGARRHQRRQRIVSRSRDIAWARCEKCHPAPCRCQERAARLGKLAKTPVPCSCPMCGNPRRYFGQETLSERRCRETSRDVD